MREIKVAPRRDFRVPVEAEKISPDIFAPLTIEEIEYMEKGERKRLRYADNEPNQQKRR